MNCGIPITGPFVRRDGRSVNWFDFAGPHSRKYASARSLQLMIAYASHEFYMMSWKYTFAPSIASNPDIVYRVLLSHYQSLIRKQRCSGPEHLCRKQSMSDYRRPLNDIGSSQTQRQHIRTCLLTIPCRAQGFQRISGLVGATSTTRTSNRYFERSPWSSFYL